IFVEKGLGGGDAAFTFVYAVFSIGSTIGALIVARRRVISTRTVIVGAAWLGLAMLVLSTAPTVLTAALLAAVMGMGSVAFMTANTSLAQLRAEPHMIGRVLAIQTVLVLGTSPIGAIAMGSLADLAGARVPIVVGGVAALVAAAFGVLAERAVRRREAAEHAGEHWLRPAGHTPAPAGSTPSARSPDRRPLT